MTLPQQGVRGGRDSAERPPLLLLPGLGCSVESWGPTLVRLAQQSGLDRPVYAVDIPGFGRSRGPRGHALSIAEHAEWIARFMDLLGIERAHVIGNSLGGQIALALARRHPERVVSVVIAGASPGGDLVSVWSMALGLAWNGISEPGMYNGVLPRMYLQTGSRRFFASVVQMRADHAVREAGAVSVPCLVVRGSKDTAVPEWAGRLLADALPNSAFSIVEGAPHAVQYAAPEAFTDLAVPFCERAENGGANAVAPALVSGDRAEDVAASQMRPPQAAQRIWVGARPVHYECLRPVALRPAFTAMGRAAADHVPSPPLILLHGLAGSGEVWQRFVPVLDRGLRRRLQGPPLRAVYVPDMPGYGRSLGLPKALRIEELADWCARFMDTLGIERADFAAHSMGCQVAIALAQRHPDRVGRLILVGPTTGAGAVPLWRYIAGMAFGASREPVWYRLLAFRMFWRMGVRHYVQTVREMMQENTLARAPTVAAPCLVVRGSRDTIIPESAARALAAAAPHGSYCEVANASHVVPFDSPDALAHIALPFWELVPSVNAAENASQNWFASSVSGVQ